MKFREKLERLIRAKHWSNRELDDALKAISPTRTKIDDDWNEVEVERGSQSTIRRRLDGTQEPRCSDLAPLAAALEVPVAYLADDAIEEPAAAPSEEPRYAKVARRLGEERAGHILQIVNDLTYEVALDRLYALDRPGASAAPPPPSPLPDRQAGEPAHGRGGGGEGSDAVPRPSRPALRKSRPNP